MLKSSAAPRLCPRRLSWALVAIFPLFFLSACPEENDPLRPDIGVVDGDRGLPLDGGDGSAIRRDGEVLADGADAIVPPQEAGGDASDAFPAGDTFPADRGPAVDQTTPTCVTRCDVVFELPAAGETDVILMGDFDDWSVGVSMVKQGGVWRAKVALPHGQLVEYKFAKNAKTQWVLDPTGKSCKEIGTNENSYRQVQCANACPIKGHDAWRDGILYFVMLDRFDNGDKSNDDPVKDRFGRPVRPIADWMGGDLQGLLDKINDGYFTRLGVSILWISNPLEAGDGAWDGNGNEIYTGYHGYWPTDMNKVEPRLGTRALLKKMIVAAHQKGIKVIMDYAMNHVHQDSPHYKAHPSWFWSYQLNGQDCKCGTPVCTWEGPEKERCWFDPFLPDFNYTVPAALTFSLDNVVSWARDVGGDHTNVGFDGFRMDAVKHIDIGWVTGMRKRLDAAFPKRDIWTVGETFTGDKGLIKHYIGSDRLRGQFDFPLHDAIRGVIVQRTGSMKDIAGFLKDNRCPYGGKAIMSTFLGNHDKQRVIHDAENKFYGRFDFPAQPASAEPYERVAMGFALLMTIPGVPLIYYGDEIGLGGGEDPDNRRMMPFNGKTYAQAGNDDAKTLTINLEQEKLYRTMAKLAAIRRANPALRRGYPEINWTATTDQILVYEMKYDNARLIVAINRSDSTEPHMNVGSGSFVDQISGKTMQGSDFSLSRRTAVILK